MNQDESILKRCSKDQLTDEYNSMQKLKTSDSNSIQLSKDQSMSSNREDFKEFKIFLPKSIKNILESIRSSQDTNNDIFNLGNHKLL